MKQLQRLNSDKIYDMSRLKTCLSKIKTKTKTKTCLCKTKTKTKTKTSTKTCKIGSRDQDSSLENSKSGHEATQQIQTPSLSSWEKCPIGVTGTGIQRMLLQLMQSPSFVLDDRAEFCELLYNSIEIRPDQLVCSQRCGTLA